MDRASKLELTALLTALGIASGTIGTTCQPAISQTNEKGPLYVAEKKTDSAKGSDSACGKGACGKDDKGAAAAKSKHKKHKAKASTKSSGTEKSDKSDGSSK